MCAVLLVSVFSAFETDATDIVFNSFKNRDVLATRTMPDLSALSVGHFGDHKNEYFGKLQTAWEQLNFDRSYISRGKLYSWTIVMSDIFIFFRVAVTGGQVMTQSNIKSLYILVKSSERRELPMKVIVCRKLSHTCITPILEETDVHYY